MTAYAVAFFASALIGSFASSVSGQKKNALILLGCLPLALLAGLRSTSVGVDTGYYPLVAFHAALDGGPIHVSQVSGCEIGFSLLIWVLTSLTQNFNAVLFCVQALMLSLLAYQLVRCDSKHVGTALFVYACIFLPWSFNLMRQALAAALFLPAFQFALEKKKLRFIITIIIAASIHRTVVIGLLIYPMCAIAAMEKARSKQFIIVLSSLFAVFLMLFISFGEVLLNWAALIKESYSYEVLGNGRFNALFTLYPAMLAVLSMFSSHGRGARRDIRDTGRKLNALMIFTSAASLMSLLSQTLFRVAYMFLIFSPLQVDYLLTSIESDSTRRVVCTVILLASAFVFLWAYCYGDASGAYPYKSDILGIV